MNDLILDVLLGVPFAVWALICGVACFGIVLGVAYIAREKRAMARPQLFDGAVECPEIFGKRAHG